MILRDALELCVQYNVPGIPFVDSDNKIVGRISIHHSVNKSCMPDYLKGVAHLLGDNIQEVNVPTLSARELLSKPVDDFVLESVNIVTSNSPLIKGLAMMEQNNSTYLFLVDKEVYRGVVTRMGIAKRMLISVAGDDAI
jgi:predicted transcriptional regulator